MNNSELLKEIEELKLKISELENACINKQEYKRWRAEKDSDTYYYISLAGKIEKYPESRQPVDNFLYSIGNYFKTQQKAEEYKENLITKQKLKDLALRLNEGFKITWNKNTCNYYIYLKYNEMLSQDEVSSCVDLGNVYCLDENFLNIAKKEIGEEALIKLIKSGV